jgi:sphingomyelin phosphodiesterase acid-like 3
MKRPLVHPILRAAALNSIGFLLLAGAAAAQSAKPAAPPVMSTVPALLVSDVHFEPFWDPAKAPQLASAPVGEWKSILAAAPSPDQPQRFAALQQACHARGADTSYALYNASLKAMRAHGAEIKFVAVGGDLVSHAFQCKYNTLFPNATPESYRAFVEKTLNYVVDQLYAAFPGVPVFVALGNNDSDCGDYRLDAHSEFLSAVGREVTKDFPASERLSAQASFASGGYYSIALPAPIQNARLLVLDDLFLSKNYATCAGKADPAAIDAQIAWLTQQLAAARAAKEKIWVLGHIPPGVDLHATASKMIDVCGGHSPVMFLSSEKLADTLTGSADVVELALFAHTPMDEIKLLRDESQSPAPAKSVAVKLIPSISPINGNRPAFIVAQLDPSSAALVDYKLFAASNSTGLDALWSEEYDFAHSYREPEFTSSTITQLIAKLTADPEAKTQASQNYIGDFSTGQLSSILTLFWPQYVCSMANHSPQSFRSCVCPVPKE